MLLKTMDRLTKGGIIMEQQSLTIEQFNHLLQGWNGKDIKITKYETKDHDETWLQLQDISYEKSQPHVDDYEPLYSLQLHGTGMVQTEQGKYAPLPTSQYDIPLDQQAAYLFDGERFSLRTDRGVYTLSLASVDTSFY